MILLDFFIEKHVYCKHKISKVPNLQAEKGIIMIPFLNMYKSQLITVQFKSITNENQC